MESLGGMVDTKRHYFSTPAQHGCAFFYNAPPEFSHHWRPSIFMGCPGGFPVTRAFWLSYKCMTHYQT
jgi:hypothetical protein